MTSMIPWGRRLRWSVSLEEEKRRRRDRDRRGSTITTTTTATTTTTTIATTTNEPQTTEVTKEREERRSPLTCPPRRMSPVFILLVINSIFLLPVAPGCPSGPRIRWRADGRCGVNFPLDGWPQPSECDPQSDRPCCSDYGYCGNSLSHCGCPDCIDYRNVIREAECYYSLEGESGYLESPNFPLEYPLGRECCYDIQRPSLRHCGVKLTVEELDVGRGEEDGYCRRDWLTLPSCVPERGARICGSNATGQVYQYLFQPGSSALRLVFHAGQEAEGRTGFKVKYDLLTTCPGPYQTQNLPISFIPGTTGAPCYTRIVDTRGTINTPYHPKPYPENLDCVYEFVRRSQDVCGIRMQTVTFEMEQPLLTVFGGACTDFLHLPSCGFLCGKVNFTWTAAFQPNAKSLKFHFHSDEATGHTGFLIGFEQVTQC
ncbi:neuropilin-2-like isoform X2 [Portunus trituberculatus]|uniref:neuropilin-2-like isoform X2 n=1 Tax=Portunus trituberculatus TaxID=210409 RepID=UPI001E1CCFDC|nr:neuropilin-2-like isoform X2 [Portunus trituberculatus]